MRELRQDWRDVFGGFRVAFDLWKIVLAFVALLLTALGGWLIGKGGLPEEAIIGCLATIFLVGVLVNAFRTALKAGGMSAKRMAVTVVAIVVIFLLALFFIVNKGIHGSVRTGCLGIWLLLVWSLFGGAIARIASVEIATDDRIGMGEALRFAANKYLSFLFAPLAPIIAIAIICVCIWVGQLVSSIPVFGNWILIWPVFALVLIAGFLIVLVGIGLVFGLPLMFPTIATEGSDSFDAISRSFSYVFSRPWKYVWYMLVGVGYGLACLLFVALFARASIYAVEWCANKEVLLKPGLHRVIPHARAKADKVLKSGRKAGDKLVGALRRVDMTAGPGREGHLVRVASAVVGNFRVGPRGELQNLEGSEKLAAKIMALLLILYLMLFAGFVASLMISLQTIIYFLLRKDVDGTDMTEVYIEEEDEEEEELLGGFGADAGESIGEAEESETADNETEADEEDSDEEDDQK